MNKLELPSNIGVFYAVQFLFILQTRNSRVRVEFV